jgi:hypothetical protein
VITLVGREYHQFEAAGRLLYLVGQIDDDAEFVALTRDSEIYRLPRVSGG